MCTRRCVCGGGGLEDSSADWILTFHVYVHSGAQTQLVKISGKCFIHGPFLQVQFLSCSH